MSFAAEVKDELCGVRAKMYAARYAECYALLLCGRAFSPRAIALQTEHGGAAHRFCSLLRQTVDVTADVACSDAGVYACSIASKDDRQRVLAAFHRGPDESALRLHSASLPRREERIAFARGAFLACGTAADPGRDYHLELLIPHHPLAGDIAALLTELGVPPRATRRGGSAVLYYKDSGAMEDFLVLTGAGDSALRLMNAKIYKDFRNRANRLTNCETANIGKTVDAGVRQLAAVEALERAGKLDALPEPLRRLAQLRREHPELSTAELGALYDPALSRSGLYHRLQKLMELAEERIKS